MDIQCLDLRLNTLETNDNCIWFEYLTHLAMQACFSKQRMKSLHNKNTWKLFCKAFSHLGSRKMLQDCVNVINYIQNPLKYAIDTSVGDIIFSFSLFTLAIQSKSESRQLFCKEVIHDNIKIDGILIFCYFIQSPNEEDFFTFYYYITEKERGNDVMLCCASLTTNFPKAKDYVFPGCQQKSQSSQQSQETVISVNFNSQSQFSPSLKVQEIYTNLTKETMIS